MLIAAVTHGAPPDDLACGPQDVRWSLLLMVDADDDLVIGNRRAGGPQSALSVGVLRHDVALVEPVLARPTHGSRTATGRDTHTALPAVWGRLCDSRKVPRRSPIRSASIRRRLSVGSPPIASRIDRIA